MIVHTAGWVRVWAVEDDMSLVTVTHACDAIEVGDYLDPFALPDAVVPNPNKPKAERDNYARVMVGVISAAPSAVATFSPSTAEPRTASPRARSLSSTGTRRKRRTSCSNWARRWR